MPRPPSVALAFLGRGSLMAALWLILAEGSLYNPVLALAVVIGATIASLRIAPPTDARIVPGGAVRFAAYFLVRSATAGVDVARRALHPALPISPGLIRYESRLAAGAARAVFTATAGLLPGTLAVGREGSMIHVHVLDTRDDVRAELTRLEDVVAGIFETHPSQKRKMSRV